MKHNLCIEVKDFRGNIFRGKPMIDGEEGEPILLKDLLVNACLVADSVDESFRTGDKKIQAYKVLQKIHTANPMADLTAEDVAMLKNLVGRSASVAAVGAVYDLLEHPQDHPPQLVEKAENNRGGYTAAEG